MCFRLVLSTARYAAPDLHKLAEILRAGSGSTRAVTYGLGALCCGYPQRLRWQLIVGTFNSPFAGYVNHRSAPFGGWFHVIARLRCLMQPTVAIVHGNRLYPLFARMSAPTL